MDKDTEYVEFPGVTGKRTIAIYWTFVEDDDKSSKFNTEAGKAKANGEYKFPYQFSDKPDQRSMDSINQYLNEKKKIPKDEKRGRERREKGRIAQKTGRGD